MNNALFSTTDLRPHTEADEAAGGAVASKGMARTTLGTTRDKVAAVIGAVVAGETIQFVTAGKWSTHELLQYLLSQTGPAKVWLSTWTMTETPVRQLVELVERGTIQELNCLLDYRVRVRTPQALQLVQYNAGRVKFAKCHAKVLVICNDVWQLTVVGSANFTNNPRIEAGTLFTDPRVADFNRGWIMDVLMDREPFKI